MSNDASVNQPVLSAPLYVVWEINGWCNARCLHCYTASGPEVDDHDSLDGDALRRVAAQLVEAGVFHVGISGGEPLLRRETVEIVRMLADGKADVSVTTNGSTVTRQVARQLKEAGVASVCVSIDSHLRHEHDRIRQHPGLFDRATSAVRLLVEEGVPVVIGMTAMRTNFEEGEAFYDFVLGLGARDINITGYVPAGRGSRDLDLTPAQLRSFLENTVRLARAYSGRLEVQWHDCRFALLDQRYSDYALKGCGAANTSCRITRKGEVTPCSLLPLSGGSLVGTSFSEIWAGSELFSKIRDRRNLGQETNCGRCEHLAQCGGCRSAAYAYSGDPFGQNPHCWLELPGPLN